MHEAKSIKQLFEVVASSSLWESATESHEIKKLTASDKLQHDELDLLSSLFRVVLLTLAHFNQANDVSVLKLGKCGNLSVNELLEWLIRVDNLDGVTGASCVFGQLDFAGDTTAERSS